LGFVGAAFDDMKPSQRVVRLKFGRSTLTKILAARPAWSKSQGTPPGTTPSRATRLQPRARRGAGRMRHDGNGDARPA
jgi:hypothetical protein